MAGWRILEDERCGRGDADADAQVRGGRSLGPSRGHHSPLALLSGTSWHNHGRNGARAGAPPGDPRKDAEVGLGLEPSSWVSVFLKLVLLPGRACVPERIPPSTPLKGSKERMGRGVHFSPEGRSLLSGLQQRGGVEGGSGLSRCLGLFATSWTVTHLAPLSMGFPRQEYWSGLPFPSPGDFPDPGIEPSSSALSWTGRWMLYH